jgi:hypothetical protein
VQVGVVGIGGAVGLLVVGIARGPASVLVFDDVVLAELLRNHVKKAKILGCHLHRGVAFEACPCEVLPKILHNFSFIPSRRSFFGDIVFSSEKTYVPSHSRKLKGNIFNEKSFGWKDFS